jgi:hypothetical protein
MIASGCESTYIKTGGRTAEPKATDCHISIYTTIPSGRYSELGLIKYNEPVRPEYIDLVLPRDREHICQSGGNAILFGNVDSEGRYRTSTILLVD